MRPAMVDSLFPHPGTPRPPHAPLIRAPVAARPGLLPGAPDGPHLHAGAPQDGMAPHRPAQREAVRGTRPARLHGFDA